MIQEHTFQFGDRDLNQRLINSLKQSDISFMVNERGAIVYHQRDEDYIENELISSIRGGVFSSWQVLTCPESCADRYIKYMKENNIPFREEFSDEERWFLLPARFRPHSWAI